MTLTTHAIVGATVASLFPLHPILAVCAAFASHYVVDSIPHWDYPIASHSINPHVGAPMKYDSAFLVDAFRIGLDILIGVLLTLWVFNYSENLSVIFLGACAGILPDPLQFIQAHFRHEPFLSLQSLHRWAHTTNHLEKSEWFGILSQIVFIFAVVGVAHFLA